VISAATRVQYLSACSAQHPLALAQNHNGVINSTLARVKPGNVRKSVGFAVLNTHLLVKACRLHPSSEPRIQSPPDLREKQLEPCFGERII